MNKNKLSEKTRKTLSITAVVLVVVFSVAISWFIGKPLIDFISEPEKFCAWVDKSGIWGRLAFVGMVMFQVVLAFVPGEPFEIGAGYAFGVVEGALLCTAGITLGSIIVFALVRKFGVKFVEIFFSMEKIRQLKFLQNEKRLNALIFLVFFLPGTPKDLLTYFVGLTGCKKSRFLITVSIARLPSVITSIVGGNALGTRKYIIAIIVFAATLLISLIGYFIYNKMLSKHK